MWEISCTKRVGTVGMVAKVPNLICDYLVINRCWLQRLQAKYVSICR